MGSRRQFIKRAGLAGAFLPLLRSGFSVAGNMPPKPQICYFTKHLQWLDYDDLAVALKDAGFDGADLTIRGGGHVEPERAASELPKVISALDKKGLTAPMAVTRVQSADDPGLDDFLQVMSDHGIKYYRMGYLEYDYNISIEKNIEHFRSVLGALAEKNEKHNICGVYQNHAGTRLGASIWDLYMSLKDIDPDYMGCQFDVRHATYEGGRSWENDFRAISDHIRTTVVKDFHWKQKADGAWTNNNTLMGHGMVDFEQYFKLYSEMDIPGPISNHSEYPLITSDEEGLPKKEKMTIAIGRLKQDVDFTRRFLSKYE
jgi:sugar phosphate isomerase/epimerase